MSVIIDVNEMIEKHLKFLGVTLTSMFFAITAVTTAYLWSTMGVVSIIAGMIIAWVTTMVMLYAFGIALLIVGGVELLSDEDWSQDDEFDD